MRVAICFFGELGFMDRFMVQNYIRCVITPIQKYENVEFFYFLHTFLDENVFTSVEILKKAFPFLIMSFHDKKMALLNSLYKKDADKTLFFEDYSMYRVKKMWKHIEDLDLVVCSRLDLLFTKPLVNSEIDFIVKNKNYFFVNNHNHCDLQRGFVIGNNYTMNIYTDRFHFLGSDKNKNFIDLMRSQYNIQKQTISIVFVRISKDGVVNPCDYQICPYLGDLIGSSSTKIRLVKRKYSHP